MGDGYHVLIWDGFGVGLVMLNPRLLTVGVDSKGNPRNWWPCPTDMSEDEKAEYVIDERGLPWLDTRPAPDDWPGSEHGSTDYANWKILG